MFSPKYCRLHSSCVILPGQTTENNALEVIIHMLYQYLTVTGRTVHGACLTFALCFWVDERPYDSISSVGFVPLFSMTWMTMTKSYLF